MRSEALESADIVVAVVSRSLKERKEIADELLVSQLE